MSPDLGLAIAACACALLPAVNFLSNLAFYRPPSAPRQRPGPLSVLIPARDEQASIAASVRSVLASRGVDLEVVVLDDGSTDGTADIVRQIAAEDRRVRLATAPPLPAGWCGKQHACSVLARLANHPTLVFLDADVRVAPDGLARSAAFLEAGPASLISGFPRQETISWLEKLLIPLIHFILLCFLPVGQMRRSLKPAYGAGCGQLFLARKEAYRRSGGHGAVRASLHDGVRLPRAFRRAGYRTDLIDCTDVASCRMYRNAAEVWHGLGKNAIEGLGAPGTILPASLLLVLGQVVPLPLVAAAALGLTSQPTAALALVALVASWLPRWIAVRRFRQPAVSALLHPLGIVLLLVIQWQALLRLVRGRPAAWKGRSYGTASAAGEAGAARERLASS